MKSFLIKPDEALASVEAIEVAYEAMWRNTWMPIKKESRGQVQP